MTEQEESDLLIDLLSISRRYGADTITDLEERLKSRRMDENIFRLLDILQNKELVLRAISRYSEKLIEESKIDIKLRVLKIEDRELVSRFVSDLYGEKVFPSREEVQRFAAENGISLLEQAPRRVFVSMLVDYMIDMPKDSMRNLIHEAYQRAARKNSLANWANVIMSK
jgi:hypothetical protein